MKILDKLERWIRPFAIPNLTLFLISLQVFVFLMDTAKPGTVQGAYLVWHEVINNFEIWRLVTFLAVPPRQPLIFLFFAWYIFYLMGVSLEGYWGAARYNLFIGLGVVFTIAAAALSPNLAASNVFLAGSVFLAFATFNPEFELMVFFVLPVKVKWLALIAWVGYGLSFLNGSAIVRLTVLASVGNYLIFFGPEMIAKFRHGRRRVRRRAEVAAAASKPRHTCVTCGITNLTDPEMDFRYCSTCSGQSGYCTEHIRNHEHI